MGAYTFESLLWPEFEALCHDLLERHLNVQLQAFSEGRDAGIDLRHAKDVDNITVVQCKHLVGSGTPALLSQMKNVELTKIQKLNPKRYVLATSCKLLKEHVDALAALLKPFVSDPHDILGEKQLNKLLRDNPDIEQRHFKLWITSTGTLKAVLHSGLFAKSRLTFDQIRRRFSLFVNVTTIQSVMEHLATHHVCILAGKPGVGKSTLAEIAITRLVSQGWEFVPVTFGMAGVHEALSRAENNKVVFYYDDFLGQISSSERGVSSENSTILSLIEHTVHSRTTYLVMTTRDYILEQARLLHERIDRAPIDLYKLTIRCQGLSAQEKAMILASHLTFYDVPEAHVAHLVSHRVCQTIISTNEFNPRLIEYMTKDRMLFAKDQSPEDYAKTFVEMLQHPHELWTHAFRNEFSPDARCLLVALATCGDGVVLKDLESAWRKILSSRLFGSEGNRFPRFVDAVREVEGACVALEQSQGKKVVRFSSPGVLDVISRLIGESEHLIDSLLSTLEYFEQVFRLVSVFGGFVDWSEKTLRQHLLNRIAEIVHDGELAVLTLTDAGGSVERRRWVTSGALVRVLDLVHFREDENVTIIEAALQPFVQIDCVSERASEMLSVVRSLQKCTWLRDEYKSWVGCQVKNWLLEVVFEDAFYGEGLDSVVCLFAEVRTHFEPGEISKWRDGMHDQFREELENTDGADSLEDLRRTLDRYEAVTGDKMRSRREQLDEKLTEIKESGGGGATFYPIGPQSGDVDSEDVAFIFESLLSTVSSKQHPEES